MNNFFEFFILSLVTWRFASLFANENGAFHMFRHLRQKFARWCRRNKFCRDFRLYEMISCEWCNSFWIGIGVTAVYYLMGRVDWQIAIFLPFALSASTIIIKLTIIHPVRCEKQ